MAETRWILWTFCGLALLLAPLSRSVQAVDSATLDGSTRAQALKQIVARIERGYVHMDMRAEIIARLREGEANDRYASQDPAEFARRVTKDLQAVTFDSHLYLRHDPRWYAAAIAPPDPAATRAENDLEQQIARITNHGLIEMKVFPGNIRYLKIEGFDWVEGETPRAYDDALRFLGGGSAIILDLRGNGGGYTQASKYLISHFVDPNTLYATFRTPNAVDEQERTADYVPAGRIKNRPLYVLIDHASRSAAEQVAYNVKQFKLGELVGETTAGASYVSDDTPIAPGFRLSVSMSEAVQAIDPAGWERVGVTPMVQTASAKALDIARLRAIERLLIDAKGVEKDQLIRARKDWPR